MKLLSLLIILNITIIAFLITPIINTKLKIKHKITRNFKSSKDSNSTEESTMEKFNSKQEDKQYSEYLINKLNKSNSKILSLLSKEIDKLELNKSSLTYESFENKHRVKNSLIISKNNQ